MKSIRQFVVRQWRLLVGLHDTPHSIAGGIAIGIFFGFPPIFGFKTLLAMVLAWIFRCSCVSAAIAVSLHDVTFFLWPVILRVEYGIGYFLLNYPHVWPPKMQARHLHFEHWLHWKSFATLGWPMLLGSLILGIPVAIVTFLIALPIVKRYQEKREALRVAKAAAASTETVG